MTVEQVIIAVLIVVICYLINNNLSQLKLINILHFENEGYLNLLEQLGAIPSDIVKDKIASMNKQRSEVKMKCK